MTTPQQTQQTTAFATAIDAWMTRERLTLGRAARWLAVKCRDLDGWRTGTRTATSAEVNHVLTRIAAGRK